MFTIIAMIAGTCVNTISLTIIIYLVQRLVIHTILVVLIVMISSSRSRRMSSISIPLVTRISLIGGFYCSGRETINPKPQTLNPRPETLGPKP